MPAVQIKKEYIILSALILAIVLALYFFLFLQPGLAKLSRFRNEAKKKLEEVTEAEKVIAQRGILEKEIERIQEELTRYEKRLPAEKELPRILEELSSNADESRIKFFSFQPLESSGPPVSPTALYSEVPIRMSLKSGFHELGEFLNSLENGERFMKVTDLTIAADPSQPRTHEVSLAISTYISRR